jgi:hypothetical protein
MDVLCGRGGLANQHDGNKVYRKVVDANKTLFKTVSRRHRTYVAESIVLAIQQAGGRFLESVGPAGDAAGTSALPTADDKTCDPRALQWVEISFRKAVLKTTQALREGDKIAIRKAAKSAAVAAADALAAAKTVNQNAVPADSLDCVSTDRISALFPAPAAPMRHPPILPRPPVVLCAPPQRLLPPPALAATAAIVYAPNSPNAPKPVALVGDHRICKTNVRGVNNRLSSSAFPSASSSTSSSSSTSLSNYQDARQDLVDEDNDNHVLGEKSNDVPQTQEDQNFEDPTDDDDDDMDVEWAPPSRKISPAILPGMGRHSPSSAATFSFQRHHHLFPYRAISGIGFVPVSSSHLLTVGLTAASSSR